MKTNFLQAKSSREQFHLIRRSAALTYKVVQADGLSEVSVSLIKQIFHSQGNFRAANPYYIWKHQPLSLLPAQRAGMGETRTE